MSCSLKQITHRSSWINDRALLLAGFIFFALYCLFSYFINTIDYDSFIRVTFVHVQEVFGIKQDYEKRILQLLSILWHVFWISAVSGFLGIPIARVFEGCIYARSEKQYNRLKEKINSYKTPLCKWHKVLLILQEKHHHNTLTKFRKFIVDGEMLDIPDYKGVLGSVRHVAKLSSLLLTVENIMQKERESNCEHVVSYYRSQVRLLHFSTDYYKHLMAFMYFIVPMFVAITIASFFEINKIFQIPEGTFQLFLGAGLIIASIQLSLIAYAQISLLAYLWRKQCKRFDDMIFKIYALIVSLGVFFFIFIVGVYQLLNTVDHVDSSLKDLIITTTNIIFPFVNLDSTHNLIKDLPVIVKMILQISTAIIFSVILKLIFEYILGKYEQSTSGEHEKHFSLPAELIGIFGAFFIFIIATGLIYSSLISNPSKINNNTSVPRKEPTHTTIDGQVVAKNEGKDDNEKMGDFLPYSIFLALVGAVLAVSTRELLENYFSGISMKVDMPFEQGDRLNIPEIGMCEVREIGLRSVKLYSVANNSIIYYPNKEISKTAISNYTQPTLDYRRSLTVNIATDFNTDDRQKVLPEIKNNFRYINDCSTQPIGVVETAKALLLLSAFMSTGVKKPSARRFFAYNWRIENPSATIQKPNRGMKFSSTRDMEEFLLKESFNMPKYNLMRLLEQVAVCKKYSEVDDEVLKLIWDRLKLIQKINEQPLEDLNLFEVPSLLDDASIVRKSIKYMDTNYIKRAKVRVSKILYILSKLEQAQYRMFDRDMAGSARLHPQIAWSLSTYISCLSSQYFSLNELLWGLKSQSEGQTGKRTIDSARLKFQDIPRVNAELCHSSEGYNYWEMTLSLTVGLAEQSDEVIYNVNKRIDWYWEETGLSKIFVRK